MPTNRTEMTLPGDAPWHYAQLLASIDGIFWEADAQTGEFTYVSEQAERLLGYPLAQWFTPNFWVDHLHQADRASASEFRSRAACGHCNHSLEYRMIAVDGQVVWLRDIVRGVVEGDTVAKQRGILLDVTEHRQAEEERLAQLWFLESIDKVNRAMQRANDLEQMMCDVLDAVLAIFACDRALLYPCDPQPTTGRVPMERTGPDYPSALAWGLAATTESGIVKVCQTVQAASGPVKFGRGAEYLLPVEATLEHGIQSMIAMAVYPKVDNPYLFALHQCGHPRTWTSQEERLFQEIGRRLGDALTNSLAYRNLQESELRYREVFENTSDVIAITEVDDDGRIKWLDFNPAWEKILGVERAAFVGKFFEGLDASETAQQVLEQYHLCLAKKTPIDFETELETTTGHWHIHTTLIPVSNAAGNIYRLVGVGRDISAQKQIEEKLRASEARFRIFVDHATDAFFLHGEGGIILDVNQRACESLGYKRDELVHIMPTEFDMDADPKFLNQLSAKLAAGETVTFESCHRRKDGTQFPVEVHMRPFEEGGQRFSVALTQDITERKQAQGALSLFRTLIDQTQDTIEVIDPKTGRYLDVNEQACLVHGYTRAEYLALTVLDLDPVVAANSWAASGGTEPWEGAHVFEGHHRRKDGSIFPVEVNANYIRLDRDYIVTVVRDITERKQAEAALKKSEEQYRILYEDNPSMYFTIDADGIVLSVNRFGAESLGYTVAELRNRSVLNVFYAEDQAAALQAVRKCMDHPGQVFHWSLRKVRKDGSLLWVEETARAVVNIDGSLVLLIVCEDITERKRTERALVESHNLLHAIVEGTADSIFVKDRQGRYLMINSAGARFLGKTVAEVLGRNDSELFTPDTAQGVMESDRTVLATGQSQIFESTATAAGVTRTYLATKSIYRDAQGALIGIIGIARDITELKRLEEQFRHAQKMEAVGRLAGGMAHDFNNLLTVINGYSGLLLRRLQVDEASRRQLGEIQKAGERAASLTHQLLAFSRKQVLQPRVVSLNQLLGELIKLLRRLIGEDIELALVPDANLGLVKIDPGQFEQAIINLVVNARDAMPQGGRLTLETHATAIDESYTERYPEVRAGHYACVAVTDTGQGMDEVTKTRIFEPFFTTKELGKGTGLGLAMVYGFVKQSDGHIEVFSQKGNGTTFKVYLPYAEETTPSAVTPTNVLQAPKGAETILLAEDEDAVRNLVRLVLQSSGYTVLEARDGQEATWVAEQHPGPIHLLVTDLIMPRMSGRQLADRLAQARPAIRVLFISGYTEGTIERQEQMETNVAFVQKPFEPASLAAKVRTLLDTKGEQS